MLLQESKETSLEALNEEAKHEMVENVVHGAGIVLAGEGNGGRLVGRLPLPSPSN